MDNENSNHPEEKKSLNESFDDSATPDVKLDGSKAKFFGNGNRGIDDNAHVTVEVDSGASFSGLGKEELMKYANDPFWVRIRMISFVIFWIGWVAMLITAIVIIVVAPKCPHRPNLKWFDVEVIYQVNPKSFKDTSEIGQEGAGIGDLNGILSKVVNRYFENLGVNALWINSFFKSGGLYDGNDIEDHTAIDTIYGSFGTLEALRKVMKKKGMKIILDFIPNHTGKKHEWFNKSRSNDPEYQDFYIWVNGQQNHLPNNWQTVYGTPAWTFDEARQQYYYHSYLPDYPDLNLRNEMVLQKLDDIMKFWLDKGMDGFAVQGLHRLVEVNTTDKNETLPGDFTDNQLENIVLVKRWRGIINSYSYKPGQERVLLASLPSVNKIKSQCDYHSAGIHLIISDVLMNLNFSTCNAKCLHDTIDTVTNGTTHNGWMIDDENHPRFGSRISENFQKALQAMHLLLPGTAVVYYGDEIGMSNVAVARNYVKDPLVAELNNTEHSRDPFRAPMLWDNTANAGFCAKNVTPWLPVDSNYMGKTVEYNNAHLVGYTILHSFKDLIALRKKESFQFGTIDMHLSHDIIYFTREASGFPSYLVALNMGGKMVGFNGFAEWMKLLYDSNGTNIVGQQYNTVDAPIGFIAGEVYVFEY